MEVKYTCDTAALFSTLRFFCGRGKNTTVGGKSDRERVKKDGNSRSDKNQRTVCECRNFPQIGFSADRLSSPSSSFISPPVLSPMHLYHLLFISRGENRLHRWIERMWFEYVDVSVSSACFKP